MKKFTPRNFTIRLSQYGALSLAFAGFADANGQIIYSGIVNEGPLNQAYILDLDGGDVRDFTLRHAGSSNYAAILDIIPEPNNAILGSASGYDFFPFALSSDYTINSTNANWNSNYQYQILSSIYCQNYASNWCNGVSDKFLGLRFQIGLDTHYGWARLDVDPIMNWKLKDYAYNATPGASIDTGQGILGVDDSFISKVKIIALNKSIALYNLPKTSNYSLYSMTGQSVLNGKIENDTHLIDAQTLSSGVYIIELENIISRAKIRKKVVL